MFESNNSIGDEIKYVFDRQKQEDQLGNNLDRPSLLMAKTFVRNTQTKEQVLKEGTTFEKVETNDE